MEDLCRKIKSERLNTRGLEFTRCVLICFIFTYLFVYLFTSFLKAVGIGGNSWVEDRMVVIKINV